jgi:hypothetical protein
VPEGAEHGFLAMVEATVARFSGDTEGAVELRTGRWRSGSASATRDLVAMSLHTKVSPHRRRAHRRGSPLMDEAMAAVVAGDLSPYFTGIIHCALIGACLS